MERRKLLSWGGAVLATSAIAGMRNRRMRRLDRSARESDRRRAGPDGAAAGADRGRRRRKPGATPPCAGQHDLRRRTTATRGSRRSRAWPSTAPATSMSRATRRRRTSPSRAAPAPPPTQGTANGVFLLQYSPTGELRWRQPFAPGPGHLRARGRRRRRPADDRRSRSWSARLGGTVTIGGTTLTSGIDPRFGLSGDQPLAHGGRLGRLRRLDQADPVDRIRVPRPGLRDQLGRHRGHRRHDRQRQRGRRAALLRQRRRPARASSPASARREIRSGATASPASSARSARAPTPTAAW